MASRKIFLGIDPDVTASGFAVYKSRKIVSLECLDLFDLTERLQAYHESYNVEVKLEAGWLAKGLNWHKGGNRSANDVGRNHEIGRQIEKFCIKKGIPYQLIKPLGYSSWKHEQFCAYTGWPLRDKTNAETRVAGMMVFGY